MFQFFYCGLGTSLVSAIMHLSLGALSWFMLNSFLEGVSTGTEKKATCLFKHHSLPQIKKIVTIIESKYLVNS